MLRSQPLISYLLLPSLSSPAEALTPLPLSLSLSFLLYVPRTMEGNEANTGSSTAALVSPMASSSSTATSTNTTPTARRRAAPARSCRVTFFPRRMEAVTQTEARMEAVTRTEVDGGGDGVAEARWTQIRASESWPSPSSQGGSTGTCSRGEGER
jgi:hypothetical protein